MRRNLENPELAAEIKGDPLESETDAEDRDLPLDEKPDRLGHPEILGPAGTWRQDGKIGAFSRSQRLSGKIGAHRHRLRSGRAKIKSERVHEGILVIDEKKPASRPGGRPARGPDDLPRT